MAWARWVRRLPANILRRWVYTDGVTFYVDQRRGPDGQRLPHLNCLTRAESQYAWSGVGRALKERRVRVDFAEHIRTWYDGVVYGHVRSEHKPEEELDQAPEQWASNGAPTPFNEVLPANLQRRGRQPRLTPLQAHDLLREHAVTDALAAYALAERLAGEGDRGLLAFLLERPNVEDFVNRVTLVRTAQMRQARSARGRVGLLEDAAAQPCSCNEADQWHSLAKATLLRNQMDGDFQRAVFKAMAEGRAKKNNVFLIGPTNAGKSFLLRPLKVLFFVYEMPDGGSHQLEDLLDKEVVFLNDFTWCAEWMKWSYFKVFLEGGSVSVARPKNRGGNALFTSDVPVFGTAFSPVQLFMREGPRVVLNQAETSQMESRMKYFWLSHSLPEEQVVRVASCAHCAARLYLEGRPAALPGPPPPAAARSRSPRREA